MSWETLDNNLVRITKQDYGKNIGKKVAIISLESIIRRTSASDNGFVARTWEWFTSAVPTTIGELILADYDLIVYTRVKSFDESCNFLERVMEALLDLGPHFLQFYVIVGTGVLSSILYEPNTSLIEDRLVPIIINPVTHLVYMGYSRTFLTNIVILLQSMRKMSRDTAPYINRIDPNTLINDDDAVYDNISNIDDSDIPEHNSPTRPAIKRKMRRPYTKMLVDPQSYIESAPDLATTLGQIECVVADMLAAGNKQVTVIVMGGRISGRSMLISKLNDLYKWPNMNVCVTKGGLSADDVKIITSAAIYVHMMMPEDLREHIANVSARLLWHRKHVTSIRPKMLDPIMPGNTNDPLRRTVFIPFVPIFRTPYERLMFIQSSVN